MKKCAVALSILLLTNTWCPMVTKAQAADTSESVSQSIPNDSKSNKNEQDPSSSDGKKVEEPLVKNDAVPLQTDKADDEEVNAPQPTDLNLENKQKDNQNSFTLSNDKIGTDLGVEKIVGTLNFYAEKDQTIKVVIPNSKAYLVEAQGLTDESKGITTIKEDSENITISTEIKQTGSYTQKITLKASIPDYGINHIANESNSLESSDGVKKQISWYINDKPQETKDIMIKIAPKIVLDEPIKRVHADENDIAEVVPGVDYDYIFKVKENNGITNTKDAQAKRINIFANYGGSTITIPVPADFKLNHDLTMSMNEFGDYENRTTISQKKAGGDITIIVPAGQGAEDFEGKDGYHLVGSFGSSRDLSYGEVSAKGKAKVTQIINPQKNEISAELEYLWTETIAQKGNQKTIDIPLTAVGSSPTQELEQISTKDDSDDVELPIVNYFGFYNKSAFDLKDVQFEIELADGLDAKAIRTPKSTAKNYTLTLKNWDYTLIFVNGDKETGSVTPGETIKRNKNLPIRKAILKPNFLASGSSSDNIGPANTKGQYGPILQNNEVNQFVVYGNLAKLHDNGRPVRSGERIVSKISAISDGKEISSKSVTQTTIPKRKELAALSVSQGNDKFTPGAKDAGWIGISKGNSSNATTNIVEEPIFYVIPPKTSFFNGKSSIIDGLAPSITTYKTDDDRQGVKIDFTGTGQHIDTKKATSVQLWFDNYIDAIPGEYPLEVYMTSRTPVTQTTKISADKLSYTQNDADAVRIDDGSTKWKIDSMGGFYSNLLVQGNADTAFTSEGSSTIHGSKDMNVSLNIQNLTTSELTDISTVINLPQDGGNSFKFALQKAIDLPEGISALYSESLESQPNSANFKTAEEVTAKEVTAENENRWSSIRSILLKKDKLNSNEGTGRLIIPGKVDGLNDKPGQVGIFKFKTFAKGKTFIENKAQVKIVDDFKSTITVHYQTEDGESIPNQEDKEISEIIGNKFSYSPEPVVQNDYAYNYSATKTANSSMTVDENKITSQFGEKNQILNLIYTRNKKPQLDESTITVHYIDDKGNELKSEVLTDKVGNDYIITPPDKIDDYKLQSWDEKKSNGIKPTGKYSNKNEDIYFIYTKENDSNHSNPGENTDNNGNSNSEDNGYKPSNPSDNGKDNSNSDSHNKGDATNTNPDNKNDSNADQSTQENANNESQSTLPLVKNNSDFVSAGEQEQLDKNSANESALPQTSEKVNNGLFGLLGLIMSSMSLLIFKKLRKDEKYEK